jgi:hypothetical protein
MNYTYLPLDSSEHKLSSECCENVLKFLIAQLKASANPSNDTQAWLLLLIYINIEKVVLTTKRG